MARPQQLELLSSAFERNVSLVPTMLLLRVAALDLPGPVADPELLAEEGAGRAAEPAGPAVLVAHEEPLHKSS